MTGIDWVIIGAVVLLALFGWAPDAGVRYLSAIFAMYAVLVAILVGLPVLVRRWIAEWRDMPLELGVGAAAIAAGVYAIVLVVPV